MTPKDRGKDLLYIFIYKVPRIQIFTLRKKYFGLLEGTCLSISWPWSLAKTC